MDIDLTTLTPEELLQLRLDVEAEQQRLDRLKQLPVEIGKLTLQYHNDGGDVYALQDLVVQELGPIVGPRPVDPNAPVEPTPEPTPEPVAPAPENTDPLPIYDPVEPVVNDEPVPTSDDTASTEPTAPDTPVQATRRRKTE